MLRVAAEDLAGLRERALADNRSVSQTALVMIRAGLAGVPTIASHANASLPTSVEPLSTELLVHNLIATEQVIQLLETIVREGPGAAGRVLAAAGRAAQERLARGEGLEVVQR